MYGKLTYGILRTAKERFHSDEEYIKAGYKKVEFSKRPIAETGFSYLPSWKEIDGKIAQIWVLVPLPDDIDDAEAYNIIFGGAE